MREGNSTFALCLCVCMFADVVFCFEACLSYIVKEQCASLRDFDNDEGRGKCRNPVIRQGSHSLSKRGAMSLVSSKFECMCKALVMESGAGGLIACEWKGK